MEVVKTPAPSLGAEEKVMLEVRGISAIPERLSTPALKGLSASSQSPELN